MSTSGSSASAAGSVVFGHRYLLGRLETRLHDSLAAAGTPSVLEPALVAGIFGEWGAGKSHLLAAVGEVVRGWQSEPGVLNVVVEFNAWRYEREEHLLIPLLKVAEQALGKALEAMLLTPEFDEVRRKELWKDRVGLVADLARSLDARGVRPLINMGLQWAGLPLALPERAKPAEAGKGAAGAPAVASPEPIWRELPRLRQQRRAERRTQLPMQQLESLYFDFLEHLKAVTGRNPAYLKKHRERLAQGWVFQNEPSDLRVNLIFLVDDLDRCLPDKAVEVLEAIKLFLEVPGCAFVLALDEEVVERGIAHRYRDYALQGKAGLTPITGAEYLEKLVHLPIRLPRPSRLEARAHLARQVPAWFQNPKNGLSNDLAEWVAYLTPPVPRKLQRMAELLQLADGMLADHSQLLREDTRRRWLALVCALQLFAPALFRYLRVQGADLLLELVDWLAGNKLRDLEALRAELAAERKQANPGRVPDALRRERLVGLVEDTLHNRSGFNLLNVLERTAELRKTHALTPLPLDDASERGQAVQVLSVLLSFVEPPGVETPPQGWEPPVVATPAGEDETAPGASVVDEDEVAPLVSRPAPHPKDYTLPRYARLENEFVLDQAVRSGDVKALLNALAQQGGSLLGHLLPDELVGRWCAAGALPWLKPGEVLTEAASEMLRTLEPHLSQWAALRLGVTFGVGPVLKALGRCGWALKWLPPEPAPGEVRLTAQVPGLAGPEAGHLLRLRVPLAPPVGGSAAEQAVRAWRRPMGAHAPALKLDGPTPGVLGVDEYGLFADFSLSGVAQRFRYLPPGEFQMGSPDGVGDADEHPRHLVRLTQGLWLAETSCTQALWLAVVRGDNPSQFKGNPLLPVEQVSWDDVMQQFMPKLQALLPAGCEASLPSEAQWEYACRAGTPTAYAWGDAPDFELANMEQKVDQTSQVGSYPPNPWGLFDMHGNVREWCFDAQRAYTEGETVDPLGAVGDGPRALRGGSWIGHARLARSAFRNQLVRVNRNVSFGFRVALRFKPSQSPSPTALHPSTKATTAAPARAS